MDGCQVQMHHSACSEHRCLCDCVSVCRQPDGRGLGRHGWSPEGGVLHSEQPLSARRHHPHYFCGGHRQLRCAALPTELPETLQSQLHACADVQQAHSAANGVQQFHSTDAQA